MSDIGSGRRPMTTKPLNIDPIAEARTFRQAVAGLLPDVAARALKDRERVLGSRNDELLRLKAFSDDVISDLCSTYLRSYVDQVGQFVENDRDHLIAELGAAPPDTPVWTTTGPGTRRLSQPGTRRPDSTPASPLVYCEVTTEPTSDRPLAPDFTLELGDGGSYTLSEGEKPVYMVFWAEW